MGLYVPHTGVVDMALARRTSGDVTLNHASTFAAVDTGLDLVLAGARVGDWLEVSLSSYIGNQAVTVVFDVATIVSGSVVSTASLGSSSSASDGLMTFYCPNAAAGPVSGLAVIGPLVAGDIAADGTVTARLLYKSGSATNRTLSASSTDPLAIAGKLLRPLYQ